MRGVRHRGKSSPLEILISHVALKWTRLDQNPMCTWTFYDQYATFSVTAMRLITPLLIAECWLFIIHYDDIMNPNLMYSRLYFLDRCFGAFTGTVLSPRSIFFVSKSILRLKIKGNVSQLWQTEHVWLELFKCSWSLKLCTLIWCFIFLWILGHIWISK